MEQRLVEPLHLVPQVPQLFTSALGLVHEPEHSINPDGQRHCALAQVLPFEQTVPQVPQLVASTAVFVHTPPQRLVPTGQPC